MVSDKTSLDGPQRLPVAHVEERKFSGTTSSPRPLVLSSSYSPSDSTTCANVSFRTFDSTFSSILEPDDPSIRSLSTLGLWMAHIGAALTLFLATTDATIVSTSLPTIASDLKASQNQYTWVGVSYMLTQTTCQPLYGRISDLIGRKNVLYASMTIFAIGSLLCGAAQTIDWLIIARAIAGVGGGGIVSSVWVMTSEIGSILVEVQNRAKWSQALSVTWSCSAIAGPLLGGFFSTRVSWRWAFYLNLPVCLVAFIVIACSLRNVHFGRSQDASWRALGQSFDFAGLLLFMGGTSCIIVGFSFATSSGWTSPSTLLLIILGIVVLVSGGIYEVHTKRDALFPVTAFTDLTTVVILLVTFLHNFAFNSGTFYLALFFQAVDGSTPLQAGIKLLPYSLGSSLASMPAAWFIGYWQKRSRDTSGQKWVICVGLIISTLGFGLMNLLNEQASTVMQGAFPLVAGIGLGLLFHAPYQIFTRALKPHELATGTSAFFLVRFTGATVGLAVAGAIFYGRASRGLPASVVSLQSSSIDFSHLRLIEPLTLRREVMHVVSTSIQTVWTVCAPCLGAALVISMLLRNLSTKEAGDLTCSQEKLSQKIKSSPTDFQTAPAV